MSRILEETREDLYTACPGRVESYDAAKQTANVKPMVKRVSREGLGSSGVLGDRVVDELPVIPAVPVSWPRGGGYFMTFPLAEGDSGLLIFSQRDIGAWRDSGQVSDPGDEGLHTLSGAVFYPGLETVARALSSGDAGTDHLVLGKEGGTQIHIDGSSVQLGAAGGDFVALSNLVTAQLNALKSAINGWTPVPNDGGAALKAALTTLFSTWPASVAATKAKAT